MLFGGVEGGATHSTLALFNDKAEKLAEVEGLGTNLFQIGMEETCHRIANMCQDAFKLAGYPPDTPLVSLGLSLSGCEVEETNDALALKMKELYPALLKPIPKVCADTVGSLLTASDSLFAKSDPTLIRKCQELANYRFEIEHVERVQR